MDNYGTHTTPAIKRWLFYRAFPGGKHTIDDVFDVGTERAALRGAFEGTHTNEFMGMPPTGKRVRVTCMNLDRFVGGKLVEHRAQVDMFGLMQAAWRRSILKRQFVCLSANALCERLRYEENWRSIRTWLSQSLLCLESVWTATWLQPVVVTAYERRTVHHTHNGPHLFP